MIEAAENVLRDMGFYDVRVRHHELAAKAAAGGAALALARIEVGVEEMKKFLENENFSRVAAALKGAGYAHVTLDLQGYRRGSAQEALAGKLEEQKIR